MIKGFNIQVGKNRNKPEAMGAVFGIFEGVSLSKEVVGSSLCNWDVYVTDYNEKTGIAEMLFKEPKHEFQIERLLETIDSLDECSMEIIYELTQEKPRLN